MEEREKPIVDVYLDEEEWKGKIEEFLRNIYALSARTEEIQAELRKLRSAVLAGAILGALLVAGAVIVAVLFR